MTAAGGDILIQVRNVVIPLLQKRTILPNLDLMNAEIDETGRQLLLSPICLHVRKPSNFVFDSWTDYQYALTDLDDSRGTAAQTGRTPALPVALLNLIW